MTDLIFVAGLLAAAPLLALLILAGPVSRFRIWPTPGAGTPRSILFWTLFRTVNIAALALAALAPGGLLALPAGVRGLGLALFAASGGLYLYALSGLGRANTYCRREGLVTHGLYRWSRNPQYATVMAAFAGLGIAADSAPVFVLSAALIAVYALMARAEEPWLRRAYGAAYERYAGVVPPFFGMRRPRLLWRVLRTCPPRRRPVRGVSGKSSVPATIARRH